MEEEQQLPDEIKEVAARFIETMTMPTEVEEKPVQGFPWSVENLPSQAD